MKLDKTSQVYINCRTQEEQNMVVDILHSLKCRWNSGNLLHEVRFHLPPMNIELDKQKIRHGSRIFDAGEAQRNYTIIEAKDLRNQWISLKRRQK